ncbi:MAG: hypothetical protein QOI82_1151 [Actinomycetota bacterium]|nr:hypothetical protein [Actinomycetota bacterium]
MRGWLYTLLSLVVLVVAADRISLLLTQRAVAAQLQTSGGLSSRPHVAIHGIPFLTQAFSGKYDDVDVSASEVTAGGGRLSKLDVTLRGVHVPLSDALSGSVAAVPVDGLTATVLLSYADISAQLRDRGLTVAPAGDQLRVSGSAQVLGRTVTASAISSIALSGASVVVTAKRFEVGNAMADRAVTAALAGRFDFVIRVGQLPYGLTMSSLSVRPEGVVATAAATHTVLQR